jgi:heme-degrading monooxygenase HmoA
MHMLVLRGRVRDGNQPDVVELARRQASAGNRTPGLIAFMAGYRRVARAERFVFVSTWKSERAALEIVGVNGDHAARAARGAVDIDRVDAYRLVAPAFAGILDAPGAVIRLSEARLRPGRHAALRRWLEAKQRELRGQHWLMAWAMGERADADGSQRLACASGWASPLLIEQFGNPGRAAGAALFADLDGFFADFHTERYQAIELALSDTRADASARRVIAARFRSEAAAQHARSSLAESIGSASENSMSVARLSSAEDGTEPRILVARVTLGDYGHAERVIVDLGGQVILAHDELVSDEPALQGDIPSLQSPRSLAAT